MEMKDEIRLDASRDAVWAALNNPDVLKACIPGCETLEMVSDTEFESLVVIKVGPIRAKFAGTVTLSEINAPVSYRLTGEGKGGVAGFAKADITVELDEEGPATTLLRYGVSANIGGKIAQLGSRMIDATARKMADQFFARFNGHFVGEDGGADQEASAPAADITAQAVVLVADNVTPTPASGATAPAAKLVAVSGAKPVAAEVASSTVALVSNQYVIVSLVDVGGEEDIEAVKVAAGTNEPAVGSALSRLFGFGNQPAKKAPAVKKKAGGSKYKAAVVTLNRPEQRNAVSLAMWRNLGHVFTELGRDPQVRAIILTGAGGHFSAGADISEFGVVRATVEQGVEYEEAVDQCCDAIADTPKPTIAVINGFCMGGACHLAMSCDFRFADPQARFGIPAARLSIVYGVRGTQRLLALVGVAQAKRILYSAQTFGADEGREIGFVDRVSSDPIRSARAFAGVMADNAPLTISGTKVLLNGLSMGMGALSDAHANAVIETAVGSADYRDARQAFVNKQRPVFTGK